MLRRNAKVDLLKRIPLFARCSRRELAKIAAVADEVELPAEKELTREGHAGKEFVVLVDGSARVQQEGRTVNQLGPGDFLGEIALLTRSARTATVTTTSPVTALIITDRAFRGVLQPSTSIQLKLLETLAERLETNAAAPRGSP